MPDAFGGTLDSVSAPATWGTAVVPHDVDALGDVPKALYIGGGGTLVARGSGGGADVTFRGLPAGSVLPFRAQFWKKYDTQAIDLEEHTPGKASAAVVNALLARELSALQNGKQLRFGSSLIAVATKRS